MAINCPYHGYIDGHNTCPACLPVCGGGGGSGLYENNTYVLNKILLELQKISRILNEKN